MSETAYYIAAISAARDMRISVTPALLISLRGNYMLVEFSDLTCGCESTQFKIVVGETGRANIGMAVNEFLHKHDFQDSYKADIAHRMRGNKWLVTLLPEAGQ